MFPVPLPVIISIAAVCVAVAFYFQNAQYLDVLGKFFPRYLNNRLVLYICIYVLSIVSNYALK